jgi:legumain
MRLALLTFLLVIVGTAIAAKHKKWALIVAGSSGWGNYRHQADACHAYQIMSQHGIPDENIVVMMYDDIADNPANPYPGKLFNKPHGPDVYEGTPKDYTGRTVTPSNFLKIMQGEDMSGVGSGKTIKSTSADHVFVFFADHGATNLIAFPSGELYAKDLNAALLKMHAAKKYKKLTFYLESCESGSMFRNQLPADINIYAMTASDYDESSWGCYCSTDMDLPCLGDLFSVNWMEDSDKADLNSETLLQQHDIVKTKTDRSKVMVYGDLKIQNETVAAYQGATVSNRTDNIWFGNDKIIRDVVPARDIPLWTLHQELERTQTGAQRENLLKRLSWFHQKRAYVDQVVSDIVTAVMPDSEQRNTVFTVKPEKTIQLGCHKLVTQQFSRMCFSLAQNTYALKHSFVFANLCEAGLKTQDIVDNVEKVCSKLQNKPDQVE